LSVAAIDPWDIAAGLIIAEGAIVTGFATVI
jgi:hypothetical protein